jgi:hypothetical protein
LQEVDVIGATYDAALHAGLTEPCERAPHQRPAECQVGDLLLTDAGVLLRECE